MRKIPAFYFDRNELARKLNSIQAPFEKAKPFPHVVFDDFLPKEILRHLIDEFPGPRSKNWEFHGPGFTSHTRRHSVEKLGIQDETKMGAFTRHFLQQLNSSTFLEFVGDVSGYRGLIPDPSYDGCGLHSTGPGGRLMIHTDVNRHPLSMGKLHQVCNAILYLNEDWKESYRGHLEFWDKNLKCHKKISPIANRFVLFQTDSASFHGHPEPLRCPFNRRRNSIAVYYYMLERPKSATYEGIQYDVKWIPTARQDFELLEETMESFESWNRAQHHHVYRFTQNVIDSLHLPWRIEEKRAAASAPLLIFDWNQFGSQREFIRLRLKSQRSGLRPFAVLGIRDPGQLLSSKGIVLLTDREAKLYVASEPDLPLTWAGYVMKLMNLLRL